MVHLPAGDWITVADAAKILDLTPRRVQALIGDGALRATKMGARLFLLLRKDVDEFAKVPRPAGRKADPKKGKPKK